MNLLLSYFYEQDPEAYIRLCEAGVGVLADSGAFSAHTLGKDIELDEYARFAAEVDGRVDAYFTLDAIGDVAQTAENHAELKRRALHPIPVWQSHDHDLAGFEEFIRDEPYVAIGSLVKTKRTRRSGGYNETRIRAFMQRAGAVAPKTRVHLLGYTDSRKREFWYGHTADSSTAQNVFMFGQPLRIPTPDGKILRVPFNDGPRNMEQVTAVRSIMPDIQIRDWPPGNQSKHGWKRALVFASAEVLYRFWRARGGPVVYIVIEPGDVPFALEGFVRSGMMEKAKYDGYMAWFNNRR